MDPPQNPPVKSDLVENPKSTYMGYSGSFRGREGGEWEGDTQNSGDDHHESDFGIGGLCSAIALFYLRTVATLAVSDLPSYPGQAGDTCGRAAMSQPSFRKQ